MENEEDFCKAKRMLKSIIFGYAEHSISEFSFLDSSRCESLMARYHVWVFLLENEYSEIYHQDLQKFIGPIVHNVINCPKAFTAFRSYSQLHLAINSHVYGDAIYEGLLSNDAIKSTINQIENGDSNSVVNVGLLTFYLTNRFPKKVYDKSEKSINFSYINFINYFCKNGKFLNYEKFFTGKRVENFDSFKKNLLSAYEREKQTCKPASLIGSVMNIKSEW